MSNTYRFDRQEMAPFVPEATTSLLDVGCANGGFGATLQARRPEIEVWGIDPDLGDAGPGDTRLIFRKLPVRCPQIGPIRLHRLQRRVGTHERPLSGARESHKLLSPSGTIVASIPNVSHYRVVLDLVLRNDWRYTERGIMDNTHLRFFTSRSMHRMFVDSGYICEVTAINMSASSVIRIPLRLLGQSGLRWKAQQYAAVARQRAVSAPAGNSRPLDVAPIRRRT